MKRSMPMRRSRAANWARLVGALAVPVLAVGALGNRIGMVPPEALVPVLVLGFLLGLLALGLGAYALADIWRSGAEGTGPAIAGIVYALPVLVLLALVAGAALHYPRLTDVTTDANAPPALVSPGDPAAAQPDPDRFALQAEAYPDIAPRVYPLPIADVYSSARALVEERNWKVTREEPPASLPPEPVSQPEAAAGAEAVDAALAAKATMTQSRASAIVKPPSGEMRPEQDQETATLQAVARTLVFGFPDDIVLRFTKTAQGTRVDMRSASGAGMHDLGQNARRIRQFFAALDEALQPDPNAPPPVRPSPGVPTAAVEPASPAATDPPGAAPAVQ